MEIQRQWVFRAQCSHTESDLLIEVFLYLGHLRPSLHQIQQELGTPKTLAPLFVLFFFNALCTCNRLLLLLFFF